MVINVSKSIKSQEVSTTAAPVKKTVKATKPATGFDSKLAGTYTATDNLHCRNGAGTNQKSLVVMPKGTKVRCYGYCSNSGGAKWLYIQFELNGVMYTGFSHSGYLKK